MEIREYILAELEHLSRVTGRVLDGINHEEALWQPGSGCNSIALMLFHSARFEDMVVHTRLQNKPMLWDAEKWYEKLNLPASETGAGYTIDRVDSFSVPDFKDLRAYAEAVREQTIVCIRSLPLDELEKPVKLPWGELNIGSLIASMIGHQAQHLGEMSYVRGLKRGMNK